MPRFQRSRQPLLYGLVRVFFAEALIVPTGILTVAFLARRFGPAGYGLLTIAMTYADWIEWTVTSSFTRATVKFVSEADDWRPAATRAIQLQFLASALAGLALALAATPISLLMREPALEGYLRLYGVGVPIYCFAHAHRDVLVGLGLFRERALVSGIRWVARLGFIVLLVELGLSVEGAILGGMASSLLEVTISRVYVRPPLFGRSGFPAKLMWEYVAPLSMFSLSKKLFDKIDLLTLKALGASAAVAGIYGGAQSLASLPSLFASALSPLILSSLGDSLREGRVDEARDKGRRALRAMMWSVPAAGLLAGTGRDLVTLLLGDVFVESVDLFEVLVFAAVALCMISIVASILIAGGKPGWTLRVTAPCLLLTTLGHVLVIPTWGAKGAAWVTLAGACGGAAVSLVMVYKLWRIFPPPTTVLRSVAIAALAYVVGVSWPVGGIWVFVKLVTLGAGMLACLRVSGELGAGDLKRLGTMLRARATTAAESAS